MSEYTLSYPFLYGKVHGCVFAKSRPVSLIWSDYKKCQTRGCCTCSFAYWSMVIQGLHAHIFHNERSHRIVLDVIHSLQSAIFYLDTPTKRSDAQPLVGRENNSSVVRLRFRGAKKVNKCGMFCILKLIFLVLGRGIRECHATSYGYLRLWCK